MYKNATANKLPNIKIFIDSGDYWKKKGFFFSQVYSSQHWYTDFKAHLILPMCR